MEQYIYDKTNGLWYERDGDYYIPCLKLPEINIGIWGERYLTYIREHKKLLHTKPMKFSLHAVQARVEASTLCGP